MALSFIVILRLTALLSYLQSYSENNCSSRVPGAFYFLCNNRRQVLGCATETPMIFLRLPNVDADDKTDIFHSNTK